MIIDAPTFTLQYRSGDLVRLKHDGPDETGKVIGAVMRVQIEYLVAFPSGTDSYNQSALEPA